MMVVYDSPLALSQRGPNIVQNNVNRLKFAANMIGNIPSTAFAGLRLPDDERSILKSDFVVFYRALQNDQIHGVSS